jgi:hypothetical protein
MIKLLKMSLTELEEYHRKRRNENYVNKRKLKAIHLRELFYPCFKLFLRIDRLLRKQKIILMGNKEKYKGQYIFACTHIGENDLENIYEVIGRGCWWFVGDPGFMYRDVSGLLVWLNGCFFCDLPYRDDCHIAFNRSVELLKKGGSLMIFPEGARNGSENLPVMKLFYGTARLSIQTGVKIVPVAIEQYKNDFVIKFGERISPDGFEGENDLTIFLRDTLATLKWDIWETKGLFNRCELPYNYGDMFLEDFEKKIHPYDTLETVERARYRSKEDIEYINLCKDLDKLRFGK